MHRVDLESRLGDELRRLPALKAPPTLLPRVMAAIQAWTLRPWYERAWFTWPVGLQMASVAGLLVLFAGGFVLWPLASNALGALATKTVEAPPILELTEALERVGRAMATGRAIWARLSSRSWLYAFPFVVLMSAAFATIGLALGRVAFGRVFQP